MWYFLALIHTSHTTNTYLKAKPSISNIERQHVSQYACQILNHCIILHVWLVKLLIYLFSVSPSIPLEDVGGVALPRGGGAYSYHSGWLLIGSSGNVFIMAGVRCICVCMCVGGRWKTLSTFEILNIRYNKHFRILCNLNWSSKTRATHHKGQK